MLGNPPFLHQGRDGRRDGIRCQFYTLESMQSKGLYLDKLHRRQDEQTLAKGDRL